MLGTLFNTVFDNWMDLLMYIFICMGAGALAVALVRQITLRYCPKAGSRLFSEEEGEFKKAA